MPIPDGYTKARLFTLGDKHLAYVGFPSGKQEPRVLIWKGKAYRREGRDDDDVAVFTQTQCYSVPDDHADT